MCCGTDLKQSKLRVSEPSLDNLDESMLHKEIAGRQKLGPD